MASKEKNPASDYYKREMNGGFAVNARLLPRHHQIMDLYIAGKNNKEIVAATGVSYRQVLNIVNTPQFQNAAALRRDRIEDVVEERIIQEADAVQAIIKANTLTAINKLVDLTEQSDNDSVARQAANDILDRGGYPKVQRQETKNESTLVIDSEQAKLLEVALKEIE